MRLNLISMSHLSQHGVFYNLAHVSFSLIFLNTYFFYAIKKRNIEQKLSNRIVSSNFPGFIVTCIASTESEWKVILPRESSSDEN